MRRFIKIKLIEETEVSKEVLEWLETIEKKLNTYFAVNPDILKGKSDCMTATEVEMRMKEYYRKG